MNLKIRNSLSSKTKSVFFIYVCINEKKNNTVIYLKHISRTKQSSIGTIPIIPRSPSTTNLKVKYVCCFKVKFSILFNDKKQNKIRRFLNKNSVSRNESNYSRIIKPTTLKWKNTVSSNSTSFFLIINEEKTANPNKTIFYISFVLRELECRNEISFWTLQPKSTTDFHMTFSTFS